MYFKNVSNDYILNNTDYQLIDVRNQHEHQSGAIPGSKLIEMHNLPREVTKLNKDKPVVVYCRSGMRSVSAAKWFVDQGFNTHNLEHGIAGWIRGGNAIE